MRNWSALLTALLALSSVLSLPPAHARGRRQQQPQQQQPQTAPRRERRKLKDFGSSLRNLAWDPERRVAVEFKPEKPKGKEKSKGQGGQAEEVLEEDEVVRVETSLVVSGVLVLARKGRAVEGLRREDFVVLEDGRAQEVGTFSLGDDARVPRTVVLIIDYSGSQFPFIRTSVDAAKTLVDRLGPLDSMAIVTDDVELIADFTGDKKKLKEKLDSLVQRATRGDGLLARTFGMSRRFGRSAQYSALLATLKEAFDDEDLRPVVIFQTDGDEAALLRDPVVRPFVPPNLPPDLHEESVRGMLMAQRYVARNRRQFSLNDVYAAAEHSRATIYTVIPGYRFVGLTPDEMLKQGRTQHEKLMAAWGGDAEQKAQWEEQYARTPREAHLAGLEQYAKTQMALVDLARLTGGWADYLEEPSQAADIYSRIFSDVSRRYVLGYYSSNKARDGTRREVKIEIKGHPEYTVWGRTYYFAPSR